MESSSVLSGKHGARWKRLSGACVSVFLAAVSLSAQTDTLVPIDSALTISAPSPTLAPPTDVRIEDKPNDDGSALIISWQPSADDTGAVSPVQSYLILRSTSPSGPFDTAGTGVSKGTSITDNGVHSGSTYYYQVVAKAMFLDATGQMQQVSAASSLSAPGSPVAQWFNTARWFVLLMVFLVGGAIIYFIEVAKSGKELYIRKIAGIDAVDDAVGRATEMGKKIYFVPGIQDMNDVQTIAGVAILGRVAQVAAEYDAILEVPVSKSIVMVTARETMKEAYARSGRSDSFQDSQVSFITEEQFAYAAAVDGMIVREKPAAIFYMGAFYAESLILSETGNAAGAIQIAGTAEPTQLPFFVAACDYTLLGEELFAASAYLSREPKQLGSLKGQDFGKAIFLIAIIGGLILASLGWFSVSDLFRVGR